MATALRSTPARSRDPKLALVQAREVAPQVPALEAERAQGRAWFIITALAFALAIPILLGLLWPVDPGWGTWAAGADDSVRVAMLGAEQRRFRYRVRDLVMPAVSQAAEILRHSAGDAPGIPFEELESLGLLPRHNRRRSMTCSRAVTATPSSSWRKPGSVSSRGRRGCTRTVFRGLIFAIAVPRDISGAHSHRPRIEERMSCTRRAGWTEALRGLERVSLPHPAFEARFEVYTDDGAVKRRPPLPRVFAMPWWSLRRCTLASRSEGAFRLGWFYLGPPQTTHLPRLGLLFPLSAGWSGGGGP